MLAQPGAQAGGPALKAPAVWKQPHKGTSILPGPQANTVTARFTCAAHSVLCACCAASGVLGAVLQVTQQQTGRGMSTCCSTVLQLPEAKMHRAQWLRAHEPATGQQEKGTGKGAAYTQPPQIGGAASSPEAGGGTRGMMRRQGFARMLCKLVQRWVTAELMQLDLCPLCQPHRVCAWRWGACCRGHGGQSQPAAMPSWHAG